MADASAGPAVAATPAGQEAATPRQAPSPPGRTEPGAAAAALPARTPARPAPFPTPTFPVTHPGAGQQQRQQQQLQSGRHGEDSALAPDRSGRLQGGGAGVQRTGRGRRDNSAASAGTPQTQSYLGGGGTPIPGPISAGRRRFFRSGRGRRRGRPRGGSGIGRGPGLGAGWGWPGRGCRWRGGVIGGGKGSLGLRLALSAPAAAAGEEHQASASGI